MRWSNVSPSALLLAGLVSFAHQTAGDEVQPPAKTRTVSAKHEPFLRWAGFGRRKPVKHEPVANISDSTIYDSEIPVAEAVDVEIRSAPHAAIPAGDMVVVPALVAGCADGQCTPYYRNRPTGCSKDKKRTMLQNRIGEPEWYRYYRCEHFGYHPTQWMPWPDGWMTCRRPMPGPHPYDLKQPAPKNSTGRRPAPPGEQAPITPPAGPRQTPERLPEPGTLPPVPPAP